MSRDFPARYAFDCPAGADLNITFTWWLDQDLTTLQDLTGYSARMKVRTDPSASAVLVSLTSPASAGTGIDLGGALGTVHVQIANATTSTFAAGIYVYDLELVDGSGLVIRWLEGPFNVTPEVTY